MQTQTATQTYTSYTPDEIEALQVGWSMIMEADDFWKARISDRHTEKQKKTRAAQHLQKLLIALGLCNNIIYCVAREHHLLDRLKRATADRQGFHCLNAEQIAPLLQKSQDGEIKVQIYIKSGWVDEKQTIATGGLISYLLENWPGALDGLDAPVATVTKMRDKLGDRPTGLMQKVTGDTSYNFGLFRIEDATGRSSRRRKMVRGQNLAVKAAPYLIVDFELILLFYEFLEQRLLRLSDRDMRETLPQHLGSNVLRVFNAVFAGVRAFGRQLAEGVKDFVGTPTEEDKPKYDLKKNAPVVFWQGSKQQTTYDFWLEDLERGIILESELSFFDRLLAARFGYKFKTERSFLGRLSELPF
jgi:hypothetical protein